MLRFKTLYPFQGDPKASQLSFAAGEMLVVDDPAKANVNGWAAGRHDSLHTHILHTGHQVVYGWFPLTYVVQFSFPDIVFPSSCDNVAFEQQRNHSQDDDGHLGFGFGDAPMGGSWRSSAPTLTTTMNDSSKTSSVSTSSSREPKHRIGSRISNTASRALSSASNAASSIASSTKSTFQEVGYRWNDIRDQQNSNLDASTSKSSRHYDEDYGPGITGSSQQQRAVVSGNGFFPGRVTNTTKTVQKFNDGMTTTSVTTTEKANGGIMPWIPSKKTSTTTTTMDAGGNTLVQNHQKTGGGFYIIPLGPIGLAACAGIAAKNAYDSHETKKQMNTSSSQSNYY